MPGSNKKMDELFEMVRENNRLLRKMKRNAIWGIVFKILFYAVIFGIPVYLYLTIFQPILGSFLDSYSKVQQVGGQLQNVTQSVPVDKFFGFLKGILNFGK